MLRLAFFFCAVAGLHLTIAHAGVAVALGVRDRLASSRREAAPEHPVEPTKPRLLNVVRVKVALMALGAFLAGVLLVMFGALTQGAAIAISVALVVALALHEVVGRRRRDAVVVRGSRVEERKQQPQAGDH